MPTSGHSWGQTMTTSLALGIPDIYLWPPGSGYIDVKTAAENLARTVPDTKYWRRRAIKSTATYWRFKTK